MTEIRLHGRVVHTVFDLLGAKEDDITHSLGWALAKSDDLAYALLNALVGTEAGRLLAVKLQTSVSGAGRTDIEIETERAHLILEAKRGWDLPTEKQLAMYAPRFKKDGVRAQTIAVVSQATAEWSAPRLPGAVAGVPVRFASWRTVATIVERTAAESHMHVEKRLLRELHQYLKGVMTVRDIDSNLVYVVSLGSKPLVSDGTSFADIVTKYQSYFHPVGGGRGGWPTQPPNYMGFRFHGELQQIRHIDDYEVQDEPWKTIHPPLAAVGWEPQPHFWYRLGPPIVPSHAVKAGGAFSARCAFGQLSTSCLRVRPSAKRGRRRK